MIYLTTLTTIKTKIMEGLHNKYFVLKPSGTDIYAQASRKAMRAYAAHIQQENPQLCKELRQWADKEWKEVTEFPPSIGDGRSVG